MSLILFNCPCSHCMSVGHFPALVLIGGFAFVQILWKTTFLSFSICDVLLLHRVRFTFCLPFMWPIPRNRDFGVSYIMARSFKPLTFLSFWGFAWIHSEWYASLDTATYMLMTSEPRTHVVIKQLYVVFVAYNRSMHSDALQEQFINLSKCLFLHSRRTMNYSRLSLCFWRE